MNILIPYDLPEDAIPVPTTDLTFYKFDKLMSAISRVVSEGHLSITIDCSGLQFVDPFGMIGLILASRSQKLRGGAPFTFYLPEGKVRSYLGRAGFLRAALQYASFEPPVDDDWLELMDLYQGTTPSLLEVTLLEGADAIPSVLEGVETALRAQLSYRKHDAFDICIMLSEICHNVFDHNEGKTVCYGAMQTYAPRRGEKFLQVSIGDDGLGIPTTLRRNPKYADLTNDWDAIVKSFENQVSEFDDLTRGNGLYHLLSLVLRHKGTVTVRSGMGKVYVRGDEKWGRRFEVAELEGTQFAMTFPTQQGGGAGG
jgi:anti-anti-sigma regulatory factor/anti-sigma regulatory factor (Ser/Thr protein kinase)